MNEWVYIFSVSEFSLLDERVCVRSSDLEQPFGILIFIPMTISSRVFPGKGCNGRWGAGVETQKNVRGEVEGWGRVPFNEPYAPLLSTYDGA